MGLKQIILLFVKFKKLAVLVLHSIKLVKKSDIK